MSNAIETDVAFKLSEAMEDVIMERKRQVMVEGWTVAHDDQHNNEEMAMAAACYAAPEPIYTHGKDYESGLLGCIVMKRAWPWDDKWWKPKDRRRNLVRAGALIVAEIERLDRGGRE